VTKKMSGEVNDQCSEETYLKLVEKLWVSVKVGSG
jgi:hypothetical protein